MRERTERERHIRAVLRGCLRRQKTELKKDIRGSRKVVYKGEEWSRAAGTAAQGNTIACAAGPSTQKIFTPKKYI